MKTEKEIKEKKLKLYEAREKFTQHVKNLPTSEDEALVLGIKLAREVFTEKISVLDWVLN